MVRQKERKRITAQSARKNDLILKIIDKHLIEIQIQTKKYGEQNSKY